MSTQAQIDANRANAQQSTGPVTDEGKAASSGNRAIHFLAAGTRFKVLSSESQATYDLLFQNNLLTFEWHSEQEYDIIERLTEHEWMRRRALSYQEGVLEATTFLADRLALFMRYESLHERAYNTCLNQLLKLRAERRTVQNGFERQTQREQQAKWQKERHETAQKARQLDADCKIIRAHRIAANNPEALQLARDVLTRHQAA